MKTKACLNASSVHGNWIRSMAPSSVALAVCWLAVVCHYMTDEVNFNAIRKEIIKFNKLMIRIWVGVFVSQCVMCRIMDTKIINHNNDGHDLRIPVSSVSFN